MYVANNASEISKIQIIRRAQEGVQETNTLQFGMYKGNIIHHIICPLIPVLHLSSQPAMKSSLTPPFNDRPHFIYS